VLFTFPSRYSFTIGRQGVLRLGGWSPHLQTGLHVSRLTQGPHARFPIRGCHPLRPAFPDGSGNAHAATGLVRFRSPLLAESRLMSFPPATEMFQFTGFASRPYGFRSGYSLARVGCPIRRSGDQRALASPPGFSQRATSFLASWRQGIHQMPLPQRLIAKTRRSQGQNQGSGIRTQASGISTRSIIATPCPRSRPKATRSRMKTLS
jgi:hypothetical protein